MIFFFFRKSIRKVWETQVQPPGTCPFSYDQIKNLSDKNNLSDNFHEGFLKCAGFALLFGFSLLMTGTWGNSLYSPAARTIGNPSIQKGLEQTRTLLIESNFMRGEK